MAPKKSKAGAGIKEQVPAEPKNTHRDAGETSEDIKPDARDKSKKKGTKKQDPEPEKSEDESHSTGDSDDEVSRSDKSEEEDGETQGNGETQKPEDNDVEETQKSASSSKSRHAEAECQSVLNQIGKKGKLDVSSKSGLENAISWMASNVGRNLSTQQLKSIWDASFTVEHRIHLHYVIIDLMRDHKGDPFFADEPFNQWKSYNWCSGEEYTATFQQMRDFLEHHLLPRASNKLKLVEQPVRVRRERAAQSVVKEICDRRLLIGERNCSPAAATESVIRVMAPPI